MKIFRAFIFALLLSHMYNCGIYSTWTILILLALGVIIIVFDEKAEERDDK